MSRQLLRHMEAAASAAGVQSSAAGIRRDTGNGRRLSLKARMHIAFAALVLLIVSNAGIAIGTHYSALPMIAGSLGLLITALLCVLLNRGVLTS